MIYLKLLWEFFKIGLFTFGGGYGAIPLIRECVERNGWLSEEMLSNMLAISESTPGPIMVNTATYIGSVQGGVLGAAVATFGVILPAFVVMILFSVLLKKVLEKPAAVSVLSGVKPCIAGIITATGIYMLVSSTSFFTDINSLIILAVLGAFYFIVLGLRKKAVSPILLICVSAVLGIVVYGLFPKV